MGKAKKKKRAGRIALSIAAGMLFMIVLVVGVVFVKARDFYNSSNYVSDEDAMDGFVKPEDTEGENNGENYTPEVPEDPTGEILTPEEEDKIQEEHKDTMNSIEILEDKDVYNVLLIGVDRRDKGWAGNSDSMILVSLNHDKDQISMISLMRDTYVNIPGYGMRKLNAAHANGAGPLLLKTIEQNFKIDVDRYATVDFSSLSKIIDLLGGVTLKISDEEAASANGSIAEQCDIRGLDPKKYYFSGGGTINCNGIQAVAYARIRYVGNYDYERTERQRIVLTKMFEKFQSMSVTQIMDFIDDVLPLVTHNIPENEIWSLATKAPSILKYSLVRDRVPYDGLFRSTYANKQNVLVLDWEQTIKKLQDTLY